MSEPKSHRGVWIGAGIALAGVILIYFGIDFPNTNLKTMVYPELIGGALLIIGCTLLGVGLIRILVALLKP